MAKIQVLLFAQLKEQAGCDSIVKQIATNATPADLIAAMDLSGPILCAVNETQVDGTHPLHDGDVVALMPPMSGG